MSSLNNEIIANENFEETLQIHEKLLEEAEKNLETHLDIELLNNTTNKLKSI